MSFDRINRAQSVRYRNTILAVALLALFVTLFWELARASIETYLTHYWNKPFADGIVSGLSHLFYTVFVITCVHLIDLQLLRAGDIADMKEVVNKAIKDSNAITKASDECGLVKLFPARKDCLDEMWGAINKAQERIWFAAVIGKDTLKSAELLKVIDTMVKEKKISLFDVRFMFLDAYTPAGALRSVLENSADDLKTFVDWISMSKEGTDAAFSNGNPYDALILPQELRTLIETFRRSPIKDRVRFLTQMPLAWILIADEIVYYQPYCYGRKGPDNPHQLERIIPDAMPISCFRGASVNGCYEAVIDHFERVWRACNRDYWYIEARNHNMREQDLLHGGIAQRLPGIVASMEQPSLSEPDRRLLPRRPCALGDVKLDIWIHKDPSKAQEFNHARDGSLVVVDQSMYGLGVNVHGLKLAPGDLLRLRVATDNETNQKGIARKYLGGNSFGYGSVRHTGTLTGMMLSTHATQSEFVQWPVDNKPARAR